MLEYQVVRLANGSDVKWLYELLDRRLGDWYCIKISTQLHYILDNTVYIVSMQLA